jgi:malonyl CoA-acyl carrier protein transacylase
MRIAMGRADPGRSARRARREQVKRLIADGTGRSPEEIPLVLASVALSVVVAGALTATVQLLRLLDYLQQEG